MTGDGHTRRLPGIPSITSRGLDVVALRPATQRATRARSHTIPAALLALLALAVWIATAPAPPPIRDQYEAFPPVRVVHAPWLRALPHVEAVTLPRWILLRDSAPRPYVLAHEYAHARQWERHGIAGFLRGYLHDRELLEHEARREAWTTCDLLPDVVPPAICAGER